MVVHRLEADQAAILEKEVTEQEIKEVVFSINSNKAPSPDGVNGFFFQKMWYLIGGEVTQAIKSFFGSGKLLREVNNTYIALIPKKQNSAQLKDFRPISCCNFMYKCISMLLANRLKRMLPNVINYAQSAFIPGRSIENNIMLA